MQPINWAQCVRVNQWLIPDLVEGYQIWSKQKHPYQNEKDYLNGLSRQKTCEIDAGVQRDQENHRREQGQQTKDLD